jgi:hypothetical protein
MHMRQARTRIKKNEREREGMMWGVAGMRGSRAQHPPLLQHVNDMSAADDTYYLPTCIYEGFKPLLTSQFADWHQVLHPVFAPSRGNRNLGQKKRAFVHRFFLRKCCARHNPACEDAHVVADVQSTVAGSSGPQHQGLEVVQPVIRLAVGRNVIILAPGRACIWWAGRQYSRLDWQVGEVETSLQSQHLHSPQDGAAVQANIHLLGSRHYDALDPVLSLEKMLLPVLNSRVVPARSGGAQTRRRVASWCLYISAADQRQLLRQLQARSPT